MRRGIAVSWMIAGILAVGSGGCCKAAEKAAKERDAALVSYAESLRGVATAMSAGDLPAPGAPCPGLRKKDEGYGGWDGYAKAVDHDVLGLLAQAGSAGFDGDEYEKWSWLTNDWVEEAIFVAAGRVKPDHQTGSHLTMVQKSPYLIVVSTKVRTMPRARSKEEFEAGEFSGMLTIVERVPAAVLCRVELEVLSSEIVEYHDRGMFSSPLEDAIEKDFRSIFTEQALAAIATVAPGLEVSFD